MRRIGRRNATVEAVETEEVAASATETYLDRGSELVGELRFAEAVRIEFDPTRISFKALLTDWFFRMHDPTTLNRQGNDLGTSYRSTIFYLDDEQERIAREAIAEVEASGKWSAPIVTTVEPVKNWSVDEDYHQDYLEKNVGGYTCHFLRPWEEGVTNRG